MLCGAFRTCARANLMRSAGFEQQIKNVVPAVNFSSKSTNDAEFHPIYRLPLISIGAALNKIKKFQVLGAGIAVPASFLANAAGVCDLEAAFSIAGVGFASTAAVCLMGQIFSNMIGVVYVTPNLQTIKFSYLNFWGDRKDVVFPREELIPLNDSALYPTDKLYKKVYRYSATKPYKIVLKGEILNSEAFEYVFKHSSE